MTWLPSVGPISEPVTNATPVAVIVIAPVLVFTAEKVTVALATVPLAVGGPVSVSVPELPIRRCTSVATAAVVCSVVALVVSATVDNPTMLVAYLLVAVTLPIGIPAHSSHG